MSAVIEVAIPLSYLPTWKVFQVCDEIEMALNRLRNFSGCNDNMRFMKFQYAEKDEAIVAKNIIVQIFRNHGILIDNQYSYIVIIDQNGLRESFNV